jgi:hypothetical protein
VNPSPSSFIGRWYIGFGIFLILCAAFTWRSTVSWQAVANGEPKRFAASLIPLMLLASVLSLFHLIRSARS